MTSTGVDFDEDWVRLLIEIKLIIGRFEEDNFNFDLLE